MRTFRQKIPSKGPNESFPGLWRLKYLKIISSLIKERAFIKPLHSLTPLRKYLFRSEGGICLVDLSGKSPAWALLKALESMSVARIRGCIQGYFLLKSNRIMARL